MTRSQQMERVLFLADRKELVKQAKNAFARYIPKTTMCNLLLNKEDRNAKFVFSTYPTILNAIDTMKNSDGSRFFSPGHFDLIVIDEAHRSIFNKYRAIFEYFDACLLGLTATPKKTVHQSTYEFFDMKNNMPTDVYEYDEAINKDHVLVPFYLIETATRIPDMKNWMRKSVKNMRMSFVKMKECQNIFHQKISISIFLILILLIR